MKQTQVDTLKILLLFVLPILLLKVGVLPIEWRFPLLALLVGVVIILVIVEKWSLKELGIRIDNLRSGFLPYLIFTLLGLLFIYGLAKFFDRNITPDLSTFDRSNLLFMPLSIAQEFIYRSYLLTKLESLAKSPIVAIALNTLLFALLHLIYPNAVLLLPVGLVAGLGFAWMYHRYPNLILISVSHMILNFAITAFCFFTITTQNC